MSKLSLFFILFIPFYINAQVNESFSDGNFTDAPQWSGNTSNFVVNSNFELQSNAGTTSVSWLYTPSKSINDATWQCKVKINYTTSSSNYAAFYIVADNENIYENSQSYYVQIGGTSDEVSLYYQNGNKKTKIIDGTDKRTDGNPVDIQIKVTRDVNGLFSLYSKLPGESEFYKEGEITHTSIKNSTYCGLLYSNTTTTGKAYIFDDIVIVGSESIDETKPVLLQSELINDTTLQLTFNEKINIDQIKADFTTTANRSFSANVDENKLIAKLDFDSKFEKGVIYDISISGARDIAGNYMDTTNIRVGIEEEPDFGDVIINEIMFNAANGGQEYVEIMNISEKLIDISELRVCIRKTDETLNTGITSITKFLMEPNTIVALTLNSDSLIRYHNTPVYANILNTSNWYSFNNEESTVVLTNLSKEKVYDELTYSDTWHHILIADTKGVSLERINPNGLSQDKNNWHSAASEVNFGTPGYQNSQYFDIKSENKEKIVWIEPEIFSPDNNGNNDICFIHYNTEYAGFVANVRVFSATGILIAEPATNALLASEGIISWNGVTNKNKIAETGIYVLYFEMFHAQTGKKLIQKLPLVISSR